MKFTKEGPPTTARLLAQVLYAVTNAATRLRRAIKATALVGRFSSHGDGFVLDPDGVYSFGSIHVGNNTDLGYRPILIATRPTIRIGSNVAYGPEVTIRGGNHRFDVVGLPIQAVSDKMRAKSLRLGHSSGAEKAAQFKRHFGVES